jgi:hypothetical protein
VFLAGRIRNFLPTDSPSERLNFSMMNFYIIDKKAIRGKIANRLGNLGDTDS